MAWGQHPTASLFAADGDSKLRRSLGRLTSSRYRCSHSKRNRHFKCKVLFPWLFSYVRENGSARHYTCENGPQLLHSALPNSFCAMSCAKPNQSTCICSHQDLVFWRIQQQLLQKSTVLISHLVSSCHCQALVIHVSQGLHQQLVFNVNTIPSCFAFF